MNLPLHPAIVHFPIALFITAFILQALHIWSSLIIFSIWLYLFFKYMDDTRIDKLALAFLGLLSLSVVVTSYLGGTLVYLHSLGIR